MITLVCIESHNCFRSHQLNPVLIQRKRNLPNMLVFLLRDLHITDVKFNYKNRETKNTMNSLERYIFEKAELNKHVLFVIRFLLQFALKFISSSVDCLLHNAIYVQCQKLIMYR